MSEIVYGVTDAGFVKKTLVVIVSELENEYRTKYGQDIDVSPQGPFGQQIGITAAGRAELWNVLEAIYTSRNPNEATGVSLDNIHAEVNLLRLDESKSQVDNTLLWGDAGTTIPAGSVATQSTTGRSFRLQSDAYIDSTSCRGIELLVAEPTGTQTYGLKVNGEQIAYAYEASHTGTFRLSYYLGMGQSIVSSVNGISVGTVNWTNNMHADTMAAWGEAVVAALSGTYPTVSASVDGLDLIVTVVGATPITSMSATVSGTNAPVVNYLYHQMGLSDVITGLSASIADCPVGLSYEVVGTDKIRITNEVDFVPSDLSPGTTPSMYAVAGSFLASEYGIWAVPASSLNTIGTTISGWNDVINPYPGSTGREAESDMEFRIRRAQFYAVGKGTEDAIRQNVINTVDGVISCRVKSNRTMTTDVEGRPAKSFEVIVEGGLADDIAQAIWDSAPAGIEIYGFREGDPFVYKDTGNAVDANGVTVVVPFTRPVSCYIYVRVTRALYDEESYPVDGDVLMKQAIVDWAYTEYVAGKNVIPQRIYTPIYKIAGVGAASVEIAMVTTLPGTPVYQYTEIAIPEYTLPLFDVSRITIVSA